MLTKIYTTQYALTIFSALYAESFNICVVEITLPQGEQINKLQFKQQKAPVSGCFLLLFVHFVLALSAGTGRYIAGIVTTAAALPMVRKQHSGILLPCLCFGSIIGAFLDLHHQVVDELPLFLHFIHHFTKHIQRQDKEKSNQTADQH